MSINKVSDIDENSYLNKILDKTKITDDTINNINSILTIENIDLVLQKIEKFKENGKVLYGKYGDTIENKEEILGGILKNISKLLNELNIKRIHNSTSSLSKKFINLGIGEQVKNFVYIEGTKISDYKTPGASCNNWVLWMQALIEYITLSDTDVIYNYQINTKHNHGLMYITIGNKKYMFDSNGKGLIFEEIGIGNIKEKRKYKPKHFDNKKEYENNFIDNSIKKDILTYDFEEKKLKIIKKYGVLTIIYKNKPLKFIDIYGFKRLTKKIGKFSNLKYIGKTPLLFNIDQIRDFIISKVNKEDRIDMSIIISKINNEKLLQFFNLSKI